MIEWTGLGSGCVFSRRPFLHQASQTSAYLAAASSLDYGPLSAEAQPKPASVMTKSVSLGGREISLSKPRLVARSHGYLWFPMQFRTGSGEWLAVMSDYADLHVGEGTCQVSGSDDGSYSWSPLVGSKGAIPF